MLGRQRNWFVYLYILEKAIAPHSSTLAWKIPGMEEPGGLQSMGSLGVGHDWVTSLSLFTFMHWRRKWQPTPVFLPGESQRWESLVGCHLWGHTELDMTEVTYQQQHICSNLSYHIAYISKIWPLLPIERLAIMSISIVCLKIPTLTIYITFEV